MTPALHIRPVTPADGDLLARLPHAPRRGNDHVTLAAVDPRDGSVAGVARSTQDDVAFAIAEGRHERDVRGALALALLGSSRRSRSRVPRMVALLRGRLAPA